MFRLSSSRARRTVLGVAVTLLFAATLSSANNRSRAAPPVPSIAVSAYPPALQARLADAYRNAREHPDDAQASGNLGMLLHANRVFDAAEVCYWRASLAAPRVFQWPYLLAVLRENMGKKPEAIQALYRALAADPDYKPARLRLAADLLDLGNIRPGRKLLEALAVSYPNSAEVHYGLGRVAAALGSTDGAVEHYEKACELFHGYGAAHEALAQAYLKLGRPDEARRESQLHAWTKGLAPPSWDPVVDSLGELVMTPAALEQTAAAALAMGRYLIAARQYERILKLDPRNGTAHNNLVFAYVKTGRLNQAEEHYRAAAAIDPDMPSLQRNYGRLLLAGNREAEAEAAFRKAIELDPRDSEARASMADLLQRRGQIADAGREYAQALELRPELLPAHLGLGRALVAEGRYEEAIPHLVRARGPEQADADAAALNALATAYLKTGRTAQAIEVLEAAWPLAMRSGESELAYRMQSDLKALRGAAAAANR